MTHLNETDYQELVSTLNKIVESKMATTEQLALCFLELMVQEYGASRYDGAMKEAIKTVNEYFGKGE